MNYYIKSNGKIYGPTHENKIQKYVISGFFSRDSFLSSNLKDWVPIDQLIPLPQILNSVSSKDLDQDESNKEIYSKRMQLSERDVINNDKVVKSRQVKLSRKISIVAIVLFLLLVLIGGGIFFMRSHKNLLNTKKEIPANFKQVCRLYQSSVGIVVVTLEDSSGKLLNEIDGFRVSSDYPIGTAFAIDKNKFATNCHVAYGVKDQKNGVLENVLLRIILNDAQKKGIKTRDGFMKYCRDNDENIKNFRNYLQKNVRVRNVEIRLAHSNGRSLSIIGVQIHPRFQANPEKNLIFKNSEFDVAILKTSESIERYFKLASPEKLYSLAPGQEIAYLGFPMEGLADNGNLDLNRPEAIFKSGTINKITDFYNVFSTPEFNKSIIHDIPAAGGASGSPIFLPTGEVVAILWGVTHTGINQEGRISSALQHNMAVRIDSLDVVRNQKMHYLQEWLGEEKQ